MGHHYLPRRLLRGFAQEDRIWTLDMKTDGAPKLLPIARVAQEPAMYSSELEVRLNNEYEQPFNVILDRLEAGGEIGAQDIEAIARYAMTMLRRVPAGRARSEKALPDVAVAVEREQLRQIHMLEQLVPDESDLAEKGRANISKVMERIRAQDIDWLWHRTILPENFPRLTAALQRMTWERWQAPAGRQLLIGDSPVLFNEYLGLRDAKAELILPVRSDTALIATWRPGPQGQLRKLSVQQTRLLNARVVARADRWIFFERHEDWVVPFVCKHSKLRDAPHARQARIP